MKKLLACLLALMLPMSALADALSLDWSMTVEPDGMVELFHATMKALPEAEQGDYPLVEEWLRELATFASSFTCRWIFDYGNGRGHAAFACKEEELFSYDLTVADGSAVLLASFLPDMPLLFVGPMSTDVTPRCIEAWQATRWSDVADMAGLICSSWFSAMEQTEETGHFAGDAYAGGTRRTTIRFDDRDLALLLDMLMDNEWPAELMTLLNHPVISAGKEPSEFSSYLRTRIRWAALGNRYRYVLHLVWDGQDALIGLSLIAYLEDQQVATLSMGAPNDPQDEIAMTAVLGYGLNGENYYIMMQELTDTEDGTRARCVLLRDPYKSFQASVADPANELLRMAVRDRSDDGVPAVGLQFSGPELWNNEIEILLSADTKDESPSFDASFSLNRTPVSSMQIAVSHAEELPPLELEGFAPIDINEMTLEEELAMSDAILAGFDAMTVKLFKLMPPKLMVLPMNDDFFNPQ